MLSGLLFPYRNAPLSPFPSSTSRFCMAGSKRLPEGSAASIFISSIIIRASPDIINQATLTLLQGLTWHGIRTCSGQELDNLCNVMTGTQGVRTGGCRIVCLATLELIGAYSHWKKYGDHGEVKQTSTLHTLVTHTLRIWICFLYPG